MKRVRLGIIGVGRMGGVYAQRLLAGEALRCELTAVCARRTERLAEFPGVRGFTSSEELIRSGLVDGVIITTPHYAHTTIGIDALRHGLHVLVDKPISVHKADAELLLVAHADPRQVFGVMFNQRAHPLYRRIHSLVRDGNLGPLRRVQWTITDWFRPQSYFTEAPWRGTWEGEGGGVLLNQSPHQLDLFQWMFGMPQRIRAFCHFGKYHDIEVEDEVTAYLEYNTGATAVFIASTGEAPGTNRLEVAGDKGRIVSEKNTLTITRNEVPASEFLRTSPEAFAVPPSRTNIERFEETGGQHIAVLDNFADAILDGVPLIAPAAEGIRSVELANAMLLSSLQRRTIELPMDGAEYEVELKRLSASAR
jgi:predicted dehydrogenase